MLVLALHIYGRDPIHESVGIVASSGAGVLRVLKSNTCLVSSRAFLTAASSRNASSRSLRKESASSVFSCSSFCASTCVAHSSRVTIKRLYDEGRQRAFNFYKASRFPCTHDLRV